MSIRGALTAIAVVFCTAATTLAAETTDVEWRQYGGSQGFDRYSSLDLINRQNVKGLKILWTRPALDPSLTRQFPDLTAGAYFRSTPIMVGRVLYGSDGVGLAEAFDAATGKTLWVQKPFAPKLSEATGYSLRGVAYWESKEPSETCRTRIFSIHANYLNALDARTGEYCRDFGTEGRVSLRFEGSSDNYFNSGGPLVVGNVIVVGGAG